LKRDFSSCAASLRGETARGPRRQPCNNPWMANPSEPSPGRYGVGQPVSRTEDPVLLRGEGRYTDDLNEPGQAYAWMVRSPHAHGLLKRISARKMPGVLAVYTAKDLEAYGPHKCLLDF
jgi:carbon-monoxide dehydrogenase large subunit